MTASIPGRDSSWSTIADRLNDELAGDYIIERELGRGGMAAVFLGYEPALDRRVAIKVMSPGLLLDSSMIQRFRQEAVTVANLSHPNIITIHAVRQVGELHCFVMKFIVGRPLAEILATHGALPLAIVRHVLWQVGTALAYAHRQGVVHRDIKPGNILIDADGESVVTDFGIAKVAESTTHTQTGAAVGTPTYMSPEQCRGTEVTWAADQYALGVVAYEMLTGKLPFTGSTFEVMQAHTDRAPTAIAAVRADCPDDLDAAVRRMMGKTPEERWPNMGAALSAAGARPLAPDDPERSELARWATDGLDVTVVRGVPSPVPLPSGRVTTPAASRLAITAPAEVNVGETITLRVTAWNARGAEIPAATAVWSSDAPEIVRVDEQTGRAAAVAPGTVTVRATAGEVRAAVSLTACRPVGVSAVPARSVAPAATWVGEATATAPAVAVAVAGRLRIGWLLVAIVVIVGGGAAAVVYRSKLGQAPAMQSEERQPAQGQPRAQPPEGPQAPVVAAHGVRWISIKPPPVLGVGEHATLAGRAYDVEQRPVVGAALAWNSDSPAIVSIDAATGVATGRAPGVAHVRATAAGREATVALTVR